jgi:hypothetical protein
MIVSDVHKVVSIAIPHTGSTSLSVWLKKHWAGRSRGQKHDWRVPEQLKNYTRITLVRNPYERMFCWWWFDNRHRQKHGEPWQSFEDFMHFMIARREIAPREEYEEGPLVIPEFYMPQVSWLFKAGIQHWIRLEDIPDALHGLPFVNGRFPGFPHENKSPNRPRIPFKQYFGRKQQELVLEYCREDFEELGYEV